MATALRSLANARSQFRLSQSVGGILHRASREAAFQSRSAIGVAEFMAAALASSSPTVAELRSLIPNPQSASQSSSAAPRPLADWDPPLSDGLWRALERATSYRERTGGNDNYVGLRYVLFAIFASRSSPLQEEAVAALDNARADRESVRETVARICMENHEPPESFEAWAKLLDDRGLGAAIQYWKGGPPSTPRPDGSLSPEPDKGGPPTPPPRGQPPIPPSKGPSPPSPRDPSVTLIDSDDPLSPKVKDRSGALQEAIAFADMIVAKQFAPPLAVGIFGDWGSGKSFFMGLLHKEVANASRRAAIFGAAAGSESGSDISFCEHVVQIRFNAWHYAESNLWASLVEHIFATLDRWALEQSGPAAAERMFEQLTTAQRLTIEAAVRLAESRRARNQAAANLARAERDLAAKRAKAASDPRTLLQAAFGTMLADPGAKRTLDEAAAGLGLPGLSRDVEAFRSAVSGLADEAKRLALLQAGITRRLARPAVAGLIVLGVLAVSMGLGWLLSRSDVLAGPAAQAGAAAVGVIGPVAAGLSWAASRTNSALARLRDFRGRLDAKLAEKIKEDADKASAMTEELALAQSKADEAAKELRLASEQAAEAARLYNGETSSGRILHFVRSRVAQGDYAKHLSFVATVRKDFEELSRLMTTPPDSDAVKAALREQRRQVAAVIAKHRELTKDERHKLMSVYRKNGSEPAAFERIVLYIDDLDRCGPKEVLAVLQAIHLLLTFPLFVVFVAVDVRWLRSALAKTYEGQIVETRGDGATASDYLEKIFQIPYWCASTTPRRRSACFRTGWVLRRMRKEPEEARRRRMGARPTAGPRTPRQAPHPLRRPAAVPRSVLPPGPRRARCV